MISRTIFAISAEESRFTLNGALLLVKPEGLTMVATDGHRLALTKVRGRLGVAWQHLQGSAAPESHAGDPEAGRRVRRRAKLRFPAMTTISSSRSGERLLLSRKLTGNFPDFERVLPKDQPHTVTLPQTDLRAAIERVAQFADERSRAIRVQFLPGEVKVLATSPKPEKAKRRSRSSTAGLRLDIGFNAQYMLDFLRAVSEDKVQFRFRDPQSAGEMRQGAAMTR